MKFHFIIFFRKQQQKSYGELSCSFKQVLMTRETQPGWLKMHKIEIWDLLGEFYENYFVLHLCWH